MDKLYLLCGAGFLLVFLIIFLRRKQKREMRRNVEDKLREEALNRLLVGEKRPSGTSLPSTPFDVKYDLNQKKKGEPALRNPVVNGKSIMIQLTEQSELSIRKYMFDIRDHITFGTATTNDIVISSSHVSKLQCEILRIGGALFIRNLGQSGQVLLRRKRKHRSVEHEAIQLLDKDALEIGEYVYILKIMPKTE